MPTTMKKRLESDDRVLIHPANGETPYKATLTDLGAWGPTILVGTTLRFLPWSAVDMIERIDADPAAEVEWCTATVHGGPEVGPESCDKRLGHDGPHRGMLTGKPFGGKR